MAGTDDGFEVCKEAIKRSDRAPERLRKWFAKIVSTPQHFLSTCMLGKSQLSHEPIPPCQRKSGAHISQGHPVATVSQGATARANSKPLLPFLGAVHNSASVLEQLLYGSIFEHRPQLVSRTKYFASYQEDRKLIGMSETCKERLENLCILTHVDVNDRRCRVEVQCREDPLGFPGLSREVLFTREFLSSDCPRRILIPRWLELEVPESKRGFHREKRGREQERE